MDSSYDQESDSLIGGIMNRIKSTHKLSTGQCIAITGFLGLILTFVLVLTLTVSLDVSHTSSPYPQSLIHYWPLYSDYVDVVGGYNGFLSLGSGNTVTFAKPPSSPFTQMWHNTPNPNSYINVTGTGMPINYTKCAWIDPTVATTNGIYILSSVDTGNYYSHAFYLNSNTGMFFLSHGVSGNICNATIPNYSISQVYHLCGVYTDYPSYSCQMYVNAVLTGLPQTNLLQSPPWNGNISTMAISIYNTGSTGVVGYLGEVALFGRGLTAHEITYVYNTLFNVSIYA